MRDMEPKDQQLTVALRIRPLSDTEQEEGATVIAHKVGDQTVVLLDPGEDPEDTLRSHRSREKTFVFDTVFDQHASQVGVYRATTQRLVDGVVSGYNATVFAYGPSGAGKTYTMLGMDAEPGIYLQTLTDLFRAIERTRASMDSSVSMSYLEIYNEVIRDLLSPSSGPLDLREDARGSIQVAGITEVSTSNAQEIMQLLTRGNRQRTQEPTAANRTSSRSHAVLQVTVRQRAHGRRPAEGVRLGRLFLVDLAGSERAAQTQNRGKRMQEGAHINRSLLALGNCINALSERGGRAQFVNFRDSKLTRLLKDALGGNSRTVMIAHISPASSCFEESRSTLLYAHRAKSIRTRVKRNLLAASHHLDQDTDIIADLRRQIAHLQSRIQRQERRGSEPGLPDPQVAMPAQDPEENSCLQMSETRAQLPGAAQTQPERQRSLVRLEDASVELHGDVSQHLLAMADWEREKTPHRAQDEGPERDQQAVAVADAAGDEGESAEPHEGALAKEEAAPLLAAQRNAAALQAELEQGLASPQGKAAPELGAQEPGAENTVWQAAHLLAQRHLLIGRLRQHWWLCERIIQDQRQLIQDAGLPVPAALDARYGLYARALAEGSLDRLLLLLSATAAACCLPDGSVGSTSPPPGEARGDQDDRKPSARRAKPVASGQSPPAGRDLEEVAAGTKSIALVAASRRCRAQDRGGGSGRSSLHLPEEPAPASGDTSPADGRRPRAIPVREGSAERKAWSGRCPRLSLSRGARPATGTPQPPSPEHLSASQTPLAPHQPPKSSGLFPAVPTASKTKPSPHAGSADSGGRGRSPLPPSSPRRPRGHSAQDPRRPL